MGEKELRLILEEVLTQVLKESIWDRFIDLATLLLSLVSIIVAIVVACIYKKQSGIFEKQKDINDAQLQMYKGAAIAAKFRLVPFFSLVIKAEGKNGQYKIKGFSMRIYEKSPVQYVNEAKLYIDSKAFELHHKFKELNEYVLNEEILLNSIDEENGKYNIKFTIKIRTISLDDFEIEVTKQLKESETIGTQQLTIATKDIKLFELAEAGSK